jgi:hypothetical protein
MTHRPDTGASDGTVICPMTTPSGLSVKGGASLGSIQNTAPSSTESPDTSVQLDQSMPIELIKLWGSPCVMPMVSHESHCESALIAQNCGLVPPMSQPNGAGTWKAGGSAIALFCSP